jgi:pyrimidine-specific ribonucleoside hydrolase
MALPILFDCDPGHDDAIAIVLALASPELDVKAITSSAGNQTPDKTLRNVLRMLTLLKRTDIPVAGGAVKPLMRDLIIADNVHGESGLDGPALPEPTFAPQDCTAVELMAKTLRESPEPMTIVSTGPQTNVALLLNSHPELHAKIDRIVIMGGAMGLGNWTPAAEFNIFVDPEAAEIVFQSGIPVVMAGWTSRIKRKYIVKIPNGSALSAILFQRSLLNYSISSLNITKMKNGDSSAHRCTTHAPLPGC